jgi:hypothetical protein
MCLYMYAHVACFSEAELSDLALGSCAVHSTRTNATLPCPKMHYQTEHFVIPDS